MSTALFDGDQPRKTQLFDTTASREAQEMQRMSGYPGEKLTGTPSADSECRQAQAERQRLRQDRPMRNGNWEAVETPELKQAREEIKRLHAELEQRVVERTRELATTNAELQKEISERRRAEADLREQNEILQRIFDHIPVMIQFVSEDGRIELVNQAWERTLGRALEGPQIRECLKRGECIDHYETQCRRKDGTLIDVSLTISPIRDASGRIIGASQMAQDITEHKCAEEALQTYSRRLIETQEAERQRLARELHDEIGQLLTAVRINFQAMQQVSTVSAMAVYLKDGLSIVDQAIAQARNLALDLRPPMLDDLGLVPVLHWYVRRQAQRAGLRVHFAAPPVLPRFPLEIAITCFRVVQEALTNIVRHAQAQQVCVELQQHGGALHVVIRDDGVGFDVRAAQQRARRGESLGLLGMQERVELAHGHCTITSTPGHGTEVQVRLPV